MKVLATALIDFRSRASFPCGLLSVWRRRPARPGHTMTDTLGNPVGFHLTGVGAHGLAGADQLVLVMKANMLVADKAVDAGERAIGRLAAAGKKAVIPSKANRKRPLIENFFARRKQFRAIATRYDRTARNFLAAVYMAARVIWLD